MRYPPELRERVFNKTQGCCHLCGGILELDFYGHPRSNTLSWEMEHDIAEALGGTDEFKNLFAAHGSCNASKGTRRSADVRAENGLTRAPLSHGAELGERLMTGAGGAAVGGTVGTFAAHWLGGSKDDEETLGKVGAVVGGLAGIFWPTRK